MTESLIYEPRLRLDDPNVMVDCMVCGHQAERGKMCSNNEGTLVTLYFHPACGTGLTGEQLHLIYTRTIEKLFRRGGKPLMLT